jgi:hypothetical protein
MMRTPAALLAILISVTLPLQAFAATRTIGDLNDGALIGPISSTAQLQQAMRDRQPLIAEAGRDLGLSAADIATVQSRIARGDARYVRIPRHLDGMAGEHGGVAFAVHDIKIPANVYGWEVDLNRPTEVVRVFIPNQCGNISYLRVPRRVVAMRPYHFVAHGIAYAPKPMATPFPIAAAPAAFAPVAAPTLAPVAFTPVTHPIVAAAHHFVFWPFLAAALIGAALSIHGGSSYSAPIVGSVAAPTPAPVASCAPALVLRRH